MHFLPDIYVPCDVCKGKRYNRETLEIRYKGKSIHEVLEMTIEEAREFFDAVPALARKLQTLMDVGLSYIAGPERDHPLGRRGTTGQAVPRAVQARYRQDPVHPRRTDHRPAFRRHPATARRAPPPARPRQHRGGDRKHNLDVIKTADWLVDLGPEGGSKGGQIIANGTPEQVAEMPQSHTGHFLKPLLERDRA